MKKFKLNGKEYEPVEMDYNMICDFEEWGISLSDVQEKSMSFMRAYIAECLGTDPEIAGREINNHLVGGGRFDEISGILSEAVDNSGFFQALSKEPETEDQPSKAKKTA